ncbi:unnamed protein product [Lepeophtheirus salmonis]|uniref:(salmon louse) hypothetical protein n=1 Tax=Lepeophtheirus salmonis TaxID=72036 RepID=A0A7R8H6P4_LEPSM|nr:unnamed protein product [Lepeophtheirus salmonis]CAF2892904.1 unnamed protein product [Lepeophtheirus salmonis]
MKISLNFIWILTCTSWTVQASEISDGTKKLLENSFGIVQNTVIQEPSSKHLKQYEFDVPTPDDLAINRLLLKIINTTEKVKKTLDNPQRKVIMERDNDGSISRGILKMFAEVRGDIFAMSNSISTSNAETTFKSLANIDDGTELSARWKEAWNEVLVVVGKTELLYSFFDQYMGQATRDEFISRDTLVDYAQSIINPRADNTSLVNALEKMHKLSVKGNDNDEDDIYSRLSALVTSENGIYSCDLNRSVYDLTWDLYNIISHTEKKGYLTIAFAFQLLREFNFGNYTVEYKFLENVLAVQNEEKMRTVQYILPQLSRAVRRCDPPRQIEGITFLKMTRLLQGFLINEVDMNEKKTCKKECKDYKVANVKGCFNQQFCSKQSACDGRLFDCTFYEADSWVCMSDDEERRYDWVHFEEGTLLGKKDQKCINKIKVDSWWRWLLYHCSYCLCKCDQPGDLSDRYWSLNPSEGRVLGLEIQQATALPEAFIDGPSKEWLENKNEIDVNKAELKNEEFMEMSYEQRAMDIDILNAPEGHVVTGVRFRNIGGHLNLEMKVTPIDYSTGELFVEGSSWIANDITPATDPSRQLVDIPYPDVPTNYNGTSLLIADNNKYILFDTTSGDNDVMQTTVPFIDAQPVETDTWLSGVGIYYKGTAGYGGYIGANQFVYSLNYKFN